MKNIMTARPKQLLFATLFTIFGAAVGSGAAYAYQGHMFNAQSDLNAAYAQLQAGIPDKGGHRIAAMALVQRALNQTGAAIAAGAP